ncbi:MAG: phosphatidylserine decarboxylase [Pseudonocardiales bacterium]
MASPRISTARHLVELARQTLPPMHPAGRPFVAGGAAATMLLRRFSPTAAVLGAVATVCCAAFFREPRRVPPENTTVTAVAVAPADGTVSSITPAPAPAELGLGPELRPRVSVFLSVFDVHVQRIPVDGEVRRVAYRPGRFLSADLDKASEVNERNSVLLRSTAGHDVAVVQIAGLVARRIVCSVQPDEKLRAGCTYGLIRFGSRVDLYLPPGSEILVRPGQHTIGGETPLARLPVVTGGLARRPAATERPAWRPAVGED